MIPQVPEQSFTNGNSKFSPVESREQHLVFFRPKCSHLLAAWQWAGDLTSLNLRFFILLSVLLWRLSEMMYKKIKRCFWHIGRVQKMIAVASTNGASIASIVLNLRTWKMPPDLTVEMRCCAFMPSTNRIQQYSLGQIALVAPLHLERQLALFKQINPWKFSCK